VRERGVRGKEGNSGRRGLSDQKSTERKKHHLLTPSDPVEPKLVILIALKASSIPSMAIERSCRELGA
jgi:hypothetical protein